MKNLSIVIAGGTGFIGQELISFFGKENKVTILTRNLPHAATNAYRRFRSIYDLQMVQWDAASQGDWYSCIDGADILINLCGKSVNCRYTPANKKAIFNSRLTPTAALGAAVQKAGTPPKLWINASSATIYRHATDHPQTESNGEIENDFSVQVCKTWENTFFKFPTPRTRKIALRLAITLGNGGVMIPFLRLCKFGLGGRQGNGKQRFSWVHSNDLCRVITFVWDNQNLHGVLNVCSPYPVTNAELMQTLRTASGNPVGCPAPAWLLKIGAALIGTETELLLKSRWVLPEKLLRHGFAFSYPNLKDAINNIINHMPESQYRLFPFFHIKQHK